MNYLLTAIVAATLSFSSWAISAEPDDSKQSVQTQKDNLPESSKTGDYLESQPNNAGETEKHTDKDKSKSSKKTNMKKSKSQTEEPEDGGVELKQ
jgi:hypothetical protein